MEYNVLLVKDEVKGMWSPIALIDIPDTEEELKDKIKNVINEMYSYLYESNRENDNINEVVNHLLDNMTACYYRIGKIFKLSWNVPVY